MSQRVGERSLPVDCRVHFAFLWAKPYEDQKDYDKSFEHYALANQLHRDTIAYDPVQTEMAHERMRETFSEASFPTEQRRGLGLSGTRSYFYRRFAEIWINVAGADFGEPLASRWHQRAARYFDDCAIPDPAEDRAGCFPNACRICSAESLKALGESLSGADSPSSFHRAIFY